MPQKQQRNTKASIGECTYVPRVPCSPGPMFPGSHVPQPCFHGRNLEKDPPQALGLDRQPVRQTCTLTPNPNHNHNPNRNPNIHDSSEFRLRKTHSLPGQIQSHGPAGSAKVVLTATAAGWNSKNATGKNTKLWVHVVLFSPPAPLSSFVILA